MTVDYRKMCGRTGCVRLHANGGSYCNPCRAEYMRAYRLLHPATEAQKARARARNRASKRRKRQEARG